MRSQALLALAAMATVLAAAQPAAAQAYYGDRGDYHTCEQQRSGRMVGGALLGAVIGGVIGNNAAAGGHQGDGTTLGAVLGGVAGAAIARGSNRCSAPVQGSYDPYEDEYRGEPGYDDGYRRGGDRYGDNRYGDNRYGDDSGLYGGPDPYRRDDRYAQGNCRMGTMTHQGRRGRTYTEEMLMCQGRDGVWRPAD